MLECAYTRQIFVGHQFLCKFKEKTILNPITIYFGNDFNSRFEQQKYFYTSQNTPSAPLVSSLTLLDSTASL